MNIGELRTLISELPDDMAVQVHVGWTWDVEESDIDDDGFILFADTPDRVGFVNMDGLQATEDSAVAAHRDLHRAAKLLARYHRVAAPTTLHEATFKFLKTIDPRWEEGSDWGNA